MGFLDWFSDLFSSDKDSGETLESLKQKEAELLVNIENAEKVVNAAWRAINRSSYGSKALLHEKAKHAENKKGFLEQELAQVRYLIKQKGTKKVA
ncbi:hypothetical protein EXS74_01925 [Candidatus Woesearchaeota archaeon]|nr:hypothetical protein [Candidatus Woesearchaeota archaeon]